MESSRRSVGDGSNSLFDRECAVLQMGNCVGNQPPRQISNYSRLVLHRIGYHNVFVYVDMMSLTPCAAMNLCFVWSWTAALLSSPLPHTHPGSVCSKRPAPTSRGTRVSCIYCMYSRDQSRRTKLGPNSRFTWSSSKW